MTTITMAKQNGSRVSVKYGNSTMNLSGTLIGFTVNAVFIQNNRTVFIHIIKNNNLVPNGKNIQLTNDNEVKMYGNRIGIKKGAMIHLYDETGRVVGQTMAR